MKYFENSILIFVIIATLTSLVKLQTTSTQRTLPTTTSQIICENHFGKGKFKGVCQNVDECTGAAFLSKSTCGNKICCIEEKACSYAENELITKSIFFRIVNNTIRNRAIYSCFSQSLALANIKNEFQAAAYLSQMIGESDYFRFLEIKRNDADYNVDPTKDEEFNYLGRGAILLRKKANYILANNNIKNLGYDIVENPERVTFPSIAFKVSAWIWTSNSYVIKTNGPANKESLNILADGTFLNFTHLTHSLTNNLDSLRDRANINDLILSEMSYTTIKRGQGVTCTNNQGYAVPLCMNDFKKPYCGCEGSIAQDSCPYGLLTNNQCRNSKIIKCCLEKCKTALDLVILMDSSGSIGKDDFLKEKQFVKNLIGSLDIGVNDTRVAIINYGTDVDIIVYFSDPYQTTQSLMTIVDSIKYKESNTNTQGALKYANEQVLLESKGMRPVDGPIPKVVVLLTDGASNVNAQNTIPEANKIKARGFNVITIGIGPSLSLPELIGVASTPNDQYLASDFNQVLTIISSVSTKTCQQPATITYEKEIISTVEKDSYKYFKLSLEVVDETYKNKSYLDTFTIELQDLSGSSKLFFSFVDNNPKGPEDSIQVNDIPGKDENFVEDVKKSFILPKYLLELFNQNNKQSREIQSKASKSKLFNIKRPTEGPNENVYVSVKGMDELNEFQIYIYNRTVNGQISIHRNIFCLGQSSTLLFALLLSIVLFKLN